MRATHDDASIEEQQGIPYCLGFAPLPAVAARAIGDVG